MLTDVDGLYDRPPSESGAKIIREVHPAALASIEFGPVSKGGRGGMEAKVGAALRALEMGIKGVVMASGTVQNIVGRLMAGEELGTYFSTSIGRKPSFDADPAQDAALSREAARVLSALDGADRTALLDSVAAALVDRADAILEANEAAVGVGPGGFNVTSTCEELSDEHATRKGSTLRELDERWA